MKVQRAKAYIIARRGWHAEMKAHKVKTCILARQGPMHRCRFKSAMGHAKAKVVKSERAMEAKRGTSKR